MNFFNADRLAGKDLAEINFLPAHADAAATRDHDGLIVEGIVDTQVKAIEAQIQALFSASSDGQPNSVGVSFTSSGDADGTLTFNNNGVAGSDKGGYTSTYRFLGTHYSNSSTIFANLVSPGPNFTRALGVEGTHELGHSLGHIGDIKFSQTVGSTLMSVDSDPSWKDPNNTPLYSPKFPAGLLFTPKQLSALYQRCEKDRRKRAGGGAEHGYYISVGKAVTKVSASSGASSTTITEKRKRE